ncbi:hypothetical protein MJG53_008722 [Ovis ammon polii x Ovis aries]|uniref:Uncharacterized protein n=1 Tax=Ovis ammon polii x Ovis aries TaxID=2918886 RepID=A0ACB9V1L7_9CETA|nr:hypothetical protein MJG53_008722 [Ovis ammon polii x Ovis aries]
MLGLCCYVGLSLIVVSYQVDPPHGSCMVLIYYWAPILFLIVPIDLEKSEKSADIGICDEEFDSPESAHQQTQGESPTEVHTTEDVLVAAEVHEIFEDYDMETENKSSETLRD